MATQTSPHSASDTLPAEIASLARLAAHACRTRSSLLSIVDDTHERFLSRHNWEDIPLERVESLAAHALNHWSEAPASADALFVVDNAGQDPAFADHPLVRREPHLGFYAAVPVRDDEGKVQAVLSVHDLQPRALDMGQLSALRQIARLASRLLSQHRTIRHLAAQVSDGTRAMETAQDLAHRDPLTGLTNRAHFLERLRALVNTRRTQRRKESAALLFVDLDRFKRINDTLGHAAGDMLLREVARRFQTCLAGEDMLARLGGDEFTVLLPHLTDPDHAENVARMLIQAVARPVQLGSEEVQVGATIGVAIYPRDGNNAETLLKNADIAMYQAKAHGGYRAYSQTMNADGYQRLLTEASLRRAIERDEIEVHYQPQYRLDDGTLYAVEALARWRHPERGPIPPAHFIQIAEQADLILPLGLAVLRRICRDAALRRAEGLEPVRVAMNVSGRQLAHPDLADQILETLRNYEITPDQLDLELTETVLVLGHPAMPETLQSLRRQGIRLLVDDFGTGYSSLAYLRHFAVDGIKIDQTFVAGLSQGPRDVALVRALIELSHGLNLPVIAEGVEQATQFHRLLDLKCDVAQGYIFHRPLTADALRQILIDHDKHPSVLRYVTRPSHRAA